ncbi:nephrin-like protein, partial [Leptotrombidium deliense]
PPGIPRIEGYRTGDAISVGDTLTLGCISRGGNPSAKLIWYKDNVTIDTSYEATDGREVTNTYSMLVKPNDNNAHFICEASNEVSVTAFTASVQLTVFYPPSNIKIIGADKARVGETLTFECVVGPSNPASEVSWVIDGRPTPAIASWTRSVKEGWVTTTNISITIRTRNQSRVTLLLKHFAILFFKPSIFKFYTLLEFRRSLASKKEYICEKAIYRDYSNPFATLKWFRGTGNDREISGLTSVSGSGVSSELIIRVKPADNEATYKCEASNPATSEPLTANVKLRVYFISSLVNIKTKPKFPKEGDKVTLIAETESCNPTCSVKCNKNGINLQQLVENAFEAQHFGKSTKSTFEFSVSPKDDNSIVICESFNKLNKTIKQRHTIRVLCEYTNFQLVCNVQMITLIL